MSSQDNDTDSDTAAALEELYNMSQNQNPDQGQNQNPLDMMIDLLNVCRQGLLPSTSEVRPMFLRFHEVFSSSTNVFEIMDSILGPNRSEFPISEITAFWNFIQSEIDYHQPMRHLKRTLLQFNTLLENKKLAEKFAQRSNCLLFENGQTARDDIPDATANANEDGTWEDIEKKSDFENFMTEIENIFLMNEWKKQGKWVMEKVYHEDTGEFVHAYKRKLTIEPSIRTLFHRNKRPKLLKLANPGSHSVERLAEWMEKHDEKDYFPTIKRNRHWFSFRDGVYYAEDDMFMRHNDPQNEIRSIEHGGEVACVYHNFDVEEYYQCEDFLDISTPDFDRVLLYQICKDMEHPTQAETKIYITILGLIGRLLYDVNERDHWQIFPFIWGYTGTGKSLIVVHVIHRFYDPKDVLDLSNNQEEKFGLGVHCAKDKLIMLASDVNDKLSHNFNQGEILQAVAGEFMTLPIKFGDPWEGLFKMHITMAGNKFPQFDDSSGQISRRAVLIKMIKAIEHPDPELAMRLHDEVGKLIIKCNRAYRYLLDEYGDNVDFHEWAPRYFKENTADILEELNPLSAFLNSRFVVTTKTLIAEGIDPSTVDLGADLNQVKSAFNKFCRENGHAPPRFNKSLYEGVFDKHGIKVEIVRGLQACYDRVIGIRIQTNNTYYTADNIEEVN
jgi:hypothetical protein